MSGPIHDWVLQARVEAFLYEYAASLDEERFLIFVADHVCYSHGCLIDNAVQISNRRYALRHHSTVRAIELGRY
jgi:hypothetical protein